MKTIAEPLMKTLSIFIFTLFVSGCEHVFPEYPDGSMTDRKMASDPKSPLFEKRILVVPTMNRSAFGGEALSKYSTELIEASVNGMEGFQTVDRSEIPELANLTTPFKTFDTERIFHVARAYAIQGVVVSTINDVSSHEDGDEVGIFRTRYRRSTARTTLALFDVDSEKRLFQKEGDGKITEEFTDFMQGLRTVQNVDVERGKSAVQKAFDPLLSDLKSPIKSVAWEGSIARVEHPRYYVNAGKSSGLKLEQFLTVTTAKQPIFDADKKLVGVAPGRLKGTLRIIDFFGKDGAVAIATNGERFELGDRIAVHFKHTGPKD